MVGEFVVIGQGGREGGRKEGRRDAERRPGMTREAEGVGSHHAVGLLLAGLLLR